jgi:hypothetical protein
MANTLETYSQVTICDDDVWIFVIPNSKISNDVRKCFELATNLEHPIKPEMFSKYLVTNEDYNRASTEERDISFFVFMKDYSLEAVKARIAKTEDSASTRRRRFNTACFVLGLDKRFDFDGTIAPEDQLPNFEDLDILKKKPSERPSNVFTTNFYFWYLDS